MPPLAINIHRTRRFHLVRFHRAVVGPPDLAHPDPDDRGYLGAEFGPIVGVRAGSTVKVRLKRLSIDPAAPLFVKSSDPAAFTIAAPRGGAVPSGAHADIQITGVTGGNPRKANLEVRYQSLTGPIIHVLTVWVFQPLNVAITPHLVTITQAGAAAGSPGAAGGRSIANLALIMPMVRAIWAHYGVTFTVGTTVNDTIPLVASGTMALSIAELGTVLGTSWVPGSINVYLIPQITPDPSNPNSVVLGIGLSRSSAASLGLPNPGIILADSGPGIARTPQYWANDMAHEIGHFFTLWHPDEASGVAAANPREDTWSRRQLMHHFNLMGEHKNWKDNVGYGHLNRGCFVTMKRLSPLTTDDQCATARGTIGGAAGPY